MVFEYIEFDLRKYLQKQSERLPLLMIKNMMYQLVSAVNYMHNSRVIHRDLKPANILVEVQSEERVVMKIADLGMARTYTLPVRPYSTPVVTLNYRAPELLLGMQDYSTGVDMWSLGCIFAELVLGQVFLKGDSEIDMIFRICRTLGVPTPQTWPGLQALPLYNEIVNKNNIMPDYQQSINNLKDSLTLHSLDCLGQDLFFKLFIYDPAQRITAAQALTHPYFYQLIDPPNISNQ